VLDVDTADETIAADAINRHGQPAIIVRTASGKFHHLYRYNGERRRIRPWAERPIDLLGDNGYALAAPSKTAKGSYEIIHGLLTISTASRRWRRLQQRQSRSHCHSSGQECARAMAATARYGNAVCEPEAAATWRE
jgi:Bifunctional DNA primase/polymerase, N-terminal